MYLISSKFKHTLNSCLFCWFSPTPCLFESIDDYIFHFSYVVSYFYYMTYYQWSMECILPEGVCWHSCRHIGHVQKESLCGWRRGQLYSSLLKGRGKPFPSPCVVVVFLLDPIFPCLCWPLLPHSVRFCPHFRNLPLSSDESDMLTNSVT